MALTLPVRSRPPPRLRIKKPPATAHFFITRMPSLISMKFSAQTLLLLVLTYATMGLAQQAPGPLPAPISKPLNAPGRPPGPPGGPPIAPGGPPPGATVPGGAPGGATAVPVAPGGAPVGASTAAPPEGNVISFTATPVSEVLAEYYRVTGRRVLRDRGLENATVTIDVPGNFTDEEYRSIIEKGLLMHGYVLVPSGVNLYKLVAAEMGNMPSAQNVPVVLRSEELPDSDQVVMHVLPLNYLSAEDASTAFQTIIPLHPYGKILAVPNAQALVITEASQTIKAYLELAKQVDQPAAETIQKTIRIERAEAEEVVEQLGTLLGLEGGGRSGSPTSRPAGGGAPPPGGAPGGQAAVGGGSASIGGGASGAGKPIIQAVNRTNSIIVVARPLDMKKIEAMVAELDAEAPTSRYISRNLKYLDLTTFLTIAEKALMRNETKSGEGGMDAARKAQQTGSQQTNNSQSLGTGNSMLGGMGTGSSMGGIGGSSLGGMGGIGGAGSSLGGGMGNLVSDLAITKKPISILIANTLVIADPASSKFFASGPPEQIKALEDLANELDVRPRQILLSAIIGEFTLGNNFNFGLDWIQTLKQVGHDGLVGGVLNTQGTAFANPSNLQNIAGFLGTGNPAAIAGLTAYGQINKNLNVFLQTLESTKRFKVLQKPTLTTLNHQAAQIYIGQQVAIAGQSYTSGIAGAGFSSTTQYIPVRLQLIITPHIFNDAEVMLEFKQTNNDISGYTTISGNQVPNISEQGLNNNLIVADRSTAMLGGLITERDTNNNSGLPFLMRIPMLKYLVGSTTKIKERKETMIFVQPVILPDVSAHMLEQAKYGDFSDHYDETAAFGVQPENQVPRAQHVEDAKPKGQKALPPPPVEEPAPKKSLFGKFKSLFKKTKPE
jgi:general secretion pathway protein D